MLEFARPLYTTQNQLKIKSEKSKESNRNLELEIDSDEEVIDETDRIILESVKD